MLSDFEHIVLPMTWKLSKRSCIALKYASVMQEYLNEYKVIKTYLIITVKCNSLDMM